MNTGIRKKFWCQIFIVSLVILKTSRPLKLINFQRIIKINQGIALLIALKIWNCLTPGNNKVIFATVVTL